MVSTTAKENGVQGEETMGLPPGDYRLIGWDLDTTGRRLIDEICQIAAFCPAANFSQYVMPFCDLSFAARRRHNIKIATVGRYRMLKDSKTGKMLKTKSEISALLDFIQWLEDVKGNAVDGVILVSYEPHKVAAPLLLVALKKYNLLERFSAVVKGFANGYAMAEVKCAKAVDSISLRTLSRVLLDKEGKLDNATERACLAYQIIQRLCEGEDRPENQGSGDGSDATYNGLVDAVRQFSQTLTKEESELSAMKLIFTHLNSLRPIFGQMLRVSRRERQRGIYLRKILAEAGIDYSLLTDTFAESGKESISKLLTSKLTKSKPKDIDELRDLIVHHFDPESKVKVEDKTRTNKEDKNIADEVSGSSTPNTAASSPVKAPSSSGDINSNTNSTNSPQSNASSPRKTAEPAAISSPESTAS